MFCYTDSKQVFGVILFSQFFEEVFRDFSAVAFYFRICSAGEEDFADLDVVFPLGDMERRGLVNAEEAAADIVEDTSVPKELYFALERVAHLSLQPNLKPMDDMGEEDQR